MDSAKYDVVVNGIRVGYESELVEQSFAKLFKLSAEKASSILKTKKIIKKGVNSEQAEQYKKRLRSIGIDVELRQQSEQPRQPKPSQPHLEVSKEKPAQSQDDASNLALMPMEPVVENKLATPEQPILVGRMTCPKCQLEQPKALECAGCGVFVDKVKPTVTKQADNSTAAPMQPVNEPVSETFDSSFDSPVLAYLLPIGAAIIGALIWYGIAVTFDYELGLIAWLIGGMIGFGAAMGGGRGDVIGGVCVVLLVLSIFGGKHMAMSSFKSTWEQEVNAITQMEIEDLEATFGMNMEELNSEEIQEAIEQAKIMANETVNNISTMDLVAESLGFIDLVFILLGAGTAFKLGRGEE